MTERTGTTDNRITHFGYDAARRLTAVGFDTNGDGTVDETVSYAYDAGGLRTQMTLPGSKTITYSYDEVGRLIGLTAWGNQHSDFHYDKAGRHVGTQRPNGLSSDYAYNPAGHLRRVRHRAGSSLRSQFNYTVDGRGNRTRAYERVAQSTTVTNTLTKTDTAVTFTRGTWTDDGAYKKTTQFSGRMQIAYTGDEALLTVGVGPDHGIIDISINGRYWRRFNTYATTPAERVIHLPQVPTLPGETSGTLEIRNHSDRHRRSTGYVFRFKQLAVIDATYNERTIDYTYDALSRLTQADYDDGTTIYDYAYDLAGNLTNNNGKTRTYNATNQLTNDGAPTPVGGNTLTYDANGNLTSDGTNTYTWDRANRLKSLGTTTYSYDGLGNRVSQTVSNTVTNYLLDLQPGLTKVLAATTGINTDHYIHAPRGLHAQSDGTNWQYITQDGLGSVRSLIDSTLNVSSAQNYAPYGEPFGTVGNFNTPFAFTGEQTDSNGQVYLRARYYDPSIGVFNSLDPYEGTMGRPMSLNGYSWVEGNPVLNVDPNGMSPSREEMILNDQFRFSCKCGWLDVTHMNPHKPGAMNDLVEETIDWNNFPGKSRMRSIYPSFIGAKGVNFGHRNAVIDENHPDYLDPERRKGVSLGIFMEINEELERQQGYFPISLAPTSYAIEDLVSDAVSYTMARDNMAAWEGFETGLNKSLWPDFIAPQLGFQTMNATKFWSDKWVDDECDIKSADESLLMFDEYQLSGGFPKNYNWEPLPAPQGATSLMATKAELNRLIGQDYLPLTLINRWKEQLGSLPGSICNSDGINQSFRSTATYNYLQTAIRSSEYGQGVWWWSRVPRDHGRRLKVVDYQANVLPRLSEYLYVALPLNPADMEC